ncbi:cytochrome c [Phenylobacterium hankyongense]|uniref:Cytochrome c n=1 Tax=Phenylobacterium hankyongense TaxID=1813876 RepID=A0A328B0Q4_9CAUL|nr:cytochrome c [Phenylobacterium hankyongense]RAK60387.1 cytochrome c [Phenylobacterium hankyongense]
MNPITRAAAAAGLLALTTACPSQAQPPSRSVWDGVYTAVQAERGKALYAANCALCHGASLSGGDMSPALSGGGFLGAWTGQSVGDLFARTRTTMPASNPGSLGGATVADITAYLLSTNQFPAGTAELPRDAQVLQQIRIDPAPAGK